jgi:AraC family transcriptional activator of pobA
MDKPFRIFELTKELVEDIISRTYDSHFHDFEELIIITHGSLQHFIDFKMEVLDAPVACYISAGKMHKLLPNNELRGWVLNYNTAFIPDSKLSFYSNLYLYQNTTHFRQLHQPVYHPLPINQRGILP